MTTSILFSALIGILLTVVAAFTGYYLGKKNNTNNSAELDHLRVRNAELTDKLSAKNAVIENNISEIRQLTSERDVEKSNVINCNKRMEDMREVHERQISELKQSHETQSLQMADNYSKQFSQLKESYETQLAQVKKNSEQMVDSLREMNKKQVEDQMALIKEQMTATSETVLKERQKELGEKNTEQVSKIIDPLRESLKNMREALNQSEEKHREAMHKLDATIQANMKNSSDLSETAARLTRALTGEVKVQGNFGELKLRQLLEDLGLKDGEQYSSQTHLRDKMGKLIKDDEGKGLIPDFILHFPNNRDIIVDSKVSFTAYERYMNTENPAEQTQYLKEHIISVRTQVDRLAKKDYSKYMKEGYNRLNFVIMYIHTEGAINLALLNDSTLWREAYDKGVLIMGPQTMYMNLRILELMWTQVRQLKNQEEIMKAANQIVERTQDFAIRFSDVESKMRDTVKSIEKLKITTSDSGMSIITAAQNLIKAGARENKKKKSLTENESQSFLDSDTSFLLSEKEGDSTFTPSQMQ